MIIKNDNFEVTFSKKGGEIQSFTNLKNGIQYMWQGDEAYWSGKNPALFPMIGNTYAGTYEIDGKTYAMKNHGLIRYATLSCMKEEETKIVMALDSSVDTLTQYPFPFHYEVAYTLDDNTLTAMYSITNTGDEDMPFTFGLHPGFNCPLVEGERFEDYTINFTNPEHMQQLIFDTEKKAPYQTKQVTLQQIPCDYALIEQYATLIYKGAKSSYVTLKGKKGHGVRMSIAGYPYIAIWTSRQGAPFICLEPWYGHGDFSNIKEDFYHREGTMLLSAKQTFTTSYTIEVF